MDVALLDESTGRLIESAAFLKAWAWDSGKTKERRTSKNAWLDQNLQHVFHFFVSPTDWIWVNNSAMENSLQLMVCFHQVNMKSNGFGMQFM